MFFWLFPTHIFLFVYFFFLPNSMPTHLSTTKVINLPDPNACLYLPARWNEKISDANNTIFYFHDLAAQDPELKPAEVLFTVTNVRNTWVSRVRNLQGAWLHFKDVRDVQGTKNAKGKRKSGLCRKSLFAIMCVCVCVCVCVWEKVFELFLRETTK